MADLTITKALSLSTDEIKNLSDTDRKKFNDLIAEYRKSRRTVIAKVTKAVETNALIEVVGVTEQKEFLVITGVNAKGEKQTIFLSFGQRENKFADATIETIEQEIVGSIINVTFEQRIAGKTSYVDKDGKEQFHEITGNFAQGLFDKASPSQVENFKKQSNLISLLAVAKEAKELGISIEELTALQAMA